MGYSNKFILAFNNLMELEGGKVTDHAGATNYGITLRNLVNVGDLDFDKNQNGVLDKQDLWAFTVIDAKKYVFKYWWKKTKLISIDHSEVAIKALDICFNFGMPRGIRTIQKSCNNLSYRKIKEDGVIGPITLARINSLCPISLLKKMRINQKFWYLRLIARDPEKYNQYRKGWLRRAST